MTEPRDELTPEQEIARVDALADRVAQQSEIERVARP